MQFYKNFAWMDSNNDVVIFQPGKAPTSFEYQANTTELLPKTVDSKLLEMAKANALWGSLAYKEDYYR